MSTFRVEQDGAGHFHFILSGRMGRLLSDSSIHSSATTCRRAIEAVRANAPYDWNYLRRENDEGAYYILKTTSGERLGVSNVFFTRAEREKAIRRLKRGVRAAHVVLRDHHRAGVRELLTALGHLFGKERSAGHGHRHSLVRG